MRTLDASRWQILWRVEAPSALPQAFTGARIAATFAPIAAIFGEWVGANTELGGLGVVIRQDSALLETARMFAAAAILTAIALILYGLVTLAERRIVTWR
jgi:ABC-type nitrate/sulfonate/bicarbonate transport system permease component